MSSSILLDIAYNLILVLTTDIFIFAKHKLPIRISGNSCRKNRVVAGPLNNSVVEHDEDEKEFNSTEKTRISHWDTSNSSENAALAMSIDHIRECIFLKLKKEDVLACRLVSPSWAHYAGIELQKCHSISLHFEQNQKTSAQPVQSSNFHSIKNKSRGTLSDFTALTMSDSADSHKSESFYETFTISNSFTFHFTTQKFNEPFQDFFNHHGRHVTKLSLCGEYPRKYFSFRTPILFRDFKYIILFQAPNLEHLEIYGDLRHYVDENPSRWKGRDKRFHANTRSINQQVPVPSLYSSKIEPRRRPKLKLRYFKIRGSVPEHIVQEILEMSPNLHEVDASGFERWGDPGDAVQKVDSLISPTEAQTRRPGPVGNLAWSPYGPSTAIENICRFL